MSQGAQTKWAGFGSESAPAFPALMVCSARRSAVSAANSPKWTGCHALAAAHRKVQSYLPTVPLLLGTADNGVGEACSRIAATRRVI